MNFQVSSEGCRQFIKQKESFRSLVYPDANGNPTIGWGHKLTPAEIESGIYKRGITQDTADQIFLQDITPFEHQVNSFELPLSQGQFDALVDFTYNLGVNDLSVLLSHGLDQVPLQLPRWIHAGGVVEPGLVSRRATEVEWWNS